MLEPLDLGTDNFRDRASRYNAVAHDDRLVGRSLKSPQIQRLRAAALRTLAEGWFSSTVGATKQNQLTRIYSHINARQNRKGTGDCDYISEVNNYGHLF